MYLRNFERSFPSGDPISGATITIYPASLTDVHTTPVTFTDANGISGTSTTSNLYGMWAATDLPDGVFYDVKVQVGSAIKWYQGRSMHEIEHLYSDQTPAANRNLLRNGGMDSWAAWVRNGSATITGISSVDREVSDYWQASTTGGGDSATGTRAAATGIASQYVSEYVYTRVGGNFKHHQSFPAAKAIESRGKTIGVTFAVYQSANARLKPYITDSAGTTFGTVQTTIGAWTIISVVRTIDAAATTLDIGWITDTPAAGTYTIRTCMILADYGATVPVFTVGAFDAGMTEAEMDRYVGLRTIVDSTALPSGNVGYLSETLNFFGRRVRDIIGAGANTWKDTIPRTLTQLVADLLLKANLAGATFTGTVKVPTYLQVDKIDALGNGGRIWLIGSGGAYVDAIIENTFNLFRVYNLSDLTKIMSFNLSTGALSIPGAFNAASAVLTGALTGTTAAFSGAISAIGATIVGSGGNPLVTLRQTAGTSFYSFGIRDTADASWLILHRELDGLFVTLATFTTATITTLNGGTPWTTANLTPGLYVLISNLSTLVASLTSAACSGNAATATSAASCTGNSATATSAAACTGNSATATTASTANALAAGALTAAMVNASYKDAAAGTDSLRTLGTGSQQAAAGNHIHTAAVTSATGTYVGSGTASRTITGLPFTPRTVLIQMTGAGFATIAICTPSGTTASNLNGVTSSVLTSGGDVISGTTFSVSLVCATNNSTYTYTWIALA